MFRRQFRAILRGVFTSNFLLSWSFAASVVTLLLRCSTLSQTAKRLNNIPLYKRLFLMTPFEKGTTITSKNHDVNFCHVTGAAACCIQVCVKHRENFKLRKILRVNFTFMHLEKRPKFLSF
jgi:hypothetical protein